MNRYYNIVIKNKIVLYNKLDIDGDAYRFSIKNDIVGVTFKINVEVQNNIRFIENYLGLTSIQVQIALDLSEKEYNDLILGNINLSTKLMWKIVKLFNVPLEYIINLPLYSII